MGWLASSCQDPPVPERSLAPHTPHCPCPARRGVGFFLFFRSKMASRCLQDAFKMQSFFHFFLISFCSDFYPNLAPTWSQLAPNLEPKSFQNPSQEPSKTHPKSHHILNDFLDGFLMDFWLPKPSKINKKSNTNSTQQHNNHNIEKPINLVIVLRFL